MLKETSQGPEKADKMDTPSMMDELTLLYNHRFLMDATSQEFAKAQKQGLALALILLDIDDFQTITNDLGPAAGDKVLVEVAKIIKNSTRDVDIVGRCGGEKFCVLLPNTHLKRATAGAERVRNLIISRVFKEGAVSFNITASLGVSCISEADTASARDLFEHADMRLYADKQRGINRVLYKKDTPEESLTPGQREATVTPSIPASPTPNRMPSAALMQYGAKTLSALYIQSIRALVNALELKDGYTATHSYMVSHYSAALAVKLGLPQDLVEVVRTAGLLHDVGKVGVPDGVLKKNGPLSNDEFTVVKTHPVLSIKVLNDLVFLRKELEIVRYHQEKYDGTGYPYALKGDNIPLGARILAICDTFEAMTANRPYRKALPVETAVAELKKCAGTQFDPKLVKVFIDSLPEILSARQIYLEGLKKTVALPQFSSQPSASTAEGQANPPPAPATN
ncbi:MAG TPA: bifunctional diguanylate cyclase/phosphohydrolase [Candidatus Tripitaka sp. YC43]